MLQNRPILFPRCNRNWENVHTQPCIDRLKSRRRAFNIRDTELRGFSVRVLPSGTKRYFVQSQSVVTAVAQSPCGLVMRMCRLPRSTSMPTWKSRYRRWTGQGPQVSPQASSARLRSPIIAPSRPSPDYRPINVVHFLPERRASLFVIHPISSENTTRYPCRYATTHNEERQ